MSDEENFKIPMAKMYGVEQVHLACKDFSIAMFATVNIGPPDYGMGMIGRIDIRTKNSWRHLQIPNQTDIKSFAQVLREFADLIEK